MGMPTEIAADVENEERLTKKRVRLPLKQRRLAHNKNGAVVAGLTAAVVSWILRTECTTLLQQHQDDGNNNAHITTMQRTVSRLASDNETLRSSLQALKQKYNEYATTTEIRESYAHEVDSILKEKLKHSEEQQSLHEEKKIMEEISHYARQVALQDITEMGVSNPCEMLKELFYSHQQWKIKEQKYNDNIITLKERIFQLTTSEKNAIKRTSELIQIHEQCESHQPSTSHLNHLISYREYRTHIEVFRNKNKELKRQVAQLKWQLNHPTELDYDESEQIKLESPTNQSICDANNRRLDDMTYHIASMVDQLSVRESEVQQQASQISSFVVDLRNSQSEVAFMKKKIIQLEEQLQLSEEEKIRIRREMNKQIQTNDSITQNKVSSQSEIPEALIRQNIELKEHRELLLQENSLLKKAWEDLPADPSSNHPDGGWSSWGATKARDISGMFLNPSYIRQATRFKSTFPAASVPSMAGPGSPHSRR